MRLLCKTNVQTTIIFVVATCLCSTGCQSKGKMPKLADLAWWKKDDIQLSSTAPPAMHFDPEPAIQMQVDGKNAAKKSVALSDPAEDIKQKLAKALKAGNKNSTQPIRTPYTLDSANDSEESNDNSFESVAGQVKTKLPDWNNSEVQSSKLSNLKEVQDSLKNALEKNKVDQSLTRASSSIASASKKVDDSWRNDVALPARSITKSLNSSIDAARDTLNRAQASATNEASSFAERDKLQQKGNQFTQSGGFQANPRFEGFNPVKSADQTSIDPQSSVSATSGFGQSKSNQFQQASNSFQIDGQSPLQQAGSQIQNNMPSRAASAVAKLNIPFDGQLPSVSQHQSPNQTRVAQAPGIPGLPSNSLRGSLQSFQQPTQQSVAPIQPNGSINSGYPSTPHSGYAPKEGNSQNNRSKPRGADVSLVNLLGNANISTSEGSRESNPMSTTQSALSNRNLSAKDVMVPSSIIQGKGSFAPGSVNSLTPPAK